MFLTLLGLGTFVVGEMSASPNQRMLVLVLANVLVLSELLSVMRKQSAIPEQPVFVPTCTRDIPFLGEKQLLGDILSITNRIQSDVDLVTRIVALIEANENSLNLIHISTTLRKLAQVKLLVPRFVNESVWTSIIVPRSIQLLSAQGSDSIFFKPAVSAVIALAKGLAAKASPELEEAIAAFISKNINRIELGSAIPLLAILPEKSSEAALLRSRIEIADNSLSQLDMAYVYGRIDYQSCIHRCSSFTVNGLSGIIKSPHIPKGVLDHIRSRLVLIEEEEAVCSVADLVAVVRVVSEVPVWVSNRLVDHFFNIPQDIVARIHPDRIYGLSAGLSSHLKNSSSIDWERVVSAIDVLTPSNMIPLDDLHEALIHRCDRIDQAVIRLVCVLAERKDLSIVNKLVGRAVEKSAVMAWKAITGDTSIVIPRRSNPRTIIAAYISLVTLPSSEPRYKAALAIVLKNPYLSGTCFLALMALEKSRNQSIIRLVEPHLGVCCEPILVRLIPLMWNSETLVHELAGRLGAGRLGTLDDIVCMVEEFAKCSCNPGLLDPLFVALQNWLVPEIPKLDLVDIARVTNVLERFSGKVEALASNTDDINTP